MRAAKIFTIAVLFGVLTALSAPAFAQVGSGETPPGKTPPPKRPPVVAPDIERRGGSQPAPSERGATLPFTGGDLVGLAVVGGVLVVGGMALSRRTRGRPARL